MVKYISTSVTLRGKFAFLVRNNLREKCEVYRPLPLFASVLHNSPIQIDPFFLITVLISHQFSKLQIYSVKVLNAFLSLHELKELVNDDANFVIIKDYYVLY